MDKFLQNFKQLRGARQIVHLDLDTYAGQALVGLRLMLHVRPSKKEGDKQRQNLRQRQNGRQ